MREEKDRRDRGRQRISNLDDNKENENVGSYKEIQEEAYSEEVTRLLHHLDKSNVLNGRRSKM